MSRIRHISYETCRRLPFVSAMVGTIISGVLLALDVIHGTEDMSHVKIIYEALVVTVGFFVVFGFSWILRFCWYQLIGILYTYVIFLCLWMGRCGLLGEYVIHCHVGLFVTGTIYTVMVLMMMNRRRRDEIG